MPVTVLEPDAFAETIFYCEEKTNGAAACDETLTFYHAYKKRPALAMIGAKVQDLATYHMPISHDNLAILLYNTPGKVGFQILLHNMTEEYEEDTCLEFARALVEVALDQKPEDGAITVDPEDLFFAADDEQALLNLLMRFCDANEFSFDGTVIRDQFNNDYALFHEQMTDDAHPTWQDAAKDCLKMSWVMAVLAEKPYPSEEELLREAYRVRYQGIYTRQQIQDAIDAWNHPAASSSKILPCGNTLGVVFH